MRYMTRNFLAIPPKKQRPACTIPFNRSELQPDRAVCKQSLLCSTWARGFAQRRGATHAVQDSVLMGTVEGNDLAASHCPPSYRQALLSCSSSSGRKQRETVSVLVCGQSDAWNPVPSYYCFLMVYSAACTWHVHNENNTKQEMSIVLI